MEVIDFESQVTDKRQAAFVIFYALDGMPWLNYPSDHPGRHELTIPTCLMINRSDGNIGFIGGMIEPGETLLDAATREVEEEIGHTIDLQLEPVVAHDIGPITTHAFLSETTYEELRKIQEKAITGVHFGSELTGVFMPHLIDYTAAIGKGGGLVNLLKASMAPSVREEMVHFLLKTEILDKETLEAICHDAGYELVKLLA